MRDVHVVIGDTQESATVLTALESGAIACDRIEPEQLVRIGPRGACALGGWRAEFRDRAPKCFQGVVLVGSPWQLPWLDPGVLDWESGRPRLVAGLLAPGWANLYLVGLETRGLRRPHLDLLVSLIHGQAGSDHPLVDDIMRFVAPSHQAPIGRGGRRLVRRMERGLRSGGAAPWWSAAHELDGPLNAPRGA